MNAIMYLRQQLSFTAREWSDLTDEDKATLRQWAVEEANALGITLS